MPTMQIANRWQAFYKQVQRNWRWHEENSETILFIGSSEVLPPPLKAEEEAALVRALQQGSHDARQKLVEHNLRLVIYIAKRFENSGLNVEDLVSIGSIGLIKAVGTYDPSKNIKLATYASKCIENEILMYMRRSYRQKAEVSFEEPLNTDWDGNELLLRDIYGTDDDLISRNIEDETDRALLHLAMSKLTEREQLIMNLRYGLSSGTELTQKQVADRLGISQSYISRLEKKIIKRLRKEFSRME